MSHQPFPEAIQSWAVEHLNEDQWHTLERFLKALQINAGKMSLISKNDLPNIWGRHIGDSLMAGVFGKLSEPSEGRWIDIGCGAGLPLIPLAIAFPSWKFTGIDTRNLRVEFLTSVVANLGLKNVMLFRGNAKVLGNLEANHGRFDVASTRAVGKIDEDAALAAPFLRPGGTFLTFKGSERLEAVDGYQAPVYAPYRLPGVDHDLHIVCAHKI